MNSSDKFLELLKSKLGDFILESSVSLGDVVLQLASSTIDTTFDLLKNDPEFDFNLLLSVTCVDYYDTELKRYSEERFELVYHLLSLKNNNRLRIKVAVPESNPEVDSIVKYYAGAEFMEREVYDMYGIKFKNHPDLRRVLMYDEFVGYPLRKDYPLQAKQPRVRLRHPEVENTARLMQRENLISINKKA